MLSRFSWPFRMLARTAFLSMAILLNVEVIASPASIIDVTGQYARETIPGTTVSAVYMQIENKMDKELTLIAAKSDVSKRIELHQHLMADGMMKMRQVEAITLPALTITQLQPAGFHIMIFDLTTGLKAGQQIEMTLLFSDQQTMTISVPVESIIKQGNTHHHHH